MITIIYVKNLGERRTSMSTIYIKALNTNACTDALKRRTTARRYGSNPFMVKGNCLVLCEKKKGTCTKVPGPAKEWTIVASHLKNFFKCRARLDARRWLANLFIYTVDAWFNPHASIVPKCISRSRKSISRKRYLIRVPRPGPPPNAGTSKGGPFH